MMKNKIYQICALGLGVLALSSCKDYLDKLPDDRTELNQSNKISQLLVDAYPTVTNNLPHEMLSDNVDDNGRGYTSPVICENYYKLVDPNEEGHDTPYDIWEGFYHSVAVVNETIKGINDMGNPDELRGYLAEAKLIRAFSMFQLAQTFCMAWDPTKAEEYQGLPYPTEPEQNINTTYTRGNLRQLYEAIDKDIEEALPYISEVNDLFAAPKYHFNTKAAYAFATRFNLYYMKWDKAIKYANMVLGADPKQVMRNYDPYRDLGRTDFANLWIRSNDQANLFLLPTYSISCRYLTWATSDRYAHNNTMASYETYWVDGPWGSGSSGNSIIYANKLYGTNQCVAFPSYEEQFEYTDKVAGIGYVHAVDNVFTGDITILERAEAYALTKQYELAVADINTWISTHCKDKVEGGEVVATAPAALTVADVKTFIEGMDYAKRTPDGWRDRSMRKRMHPQGFTVDAGEMEDLLQFILHMKRIETVFHGLRFCDVKRYGIEYTHDVRFEDPVIFIRGDYRGAVQIPNTVIAAGMDANPRMTKEEIAAIIAATEDEYKADDEDE